MWALEVGENDCPQREYPHGINYSGGDDPIPDEDFLFAVFGATTETQRY